MVSPQNSGMACSTSQVSVLQGCKQGALPRYKFRSGSAFTLPPPGSDAAGRGVTQPDLPRGLSARPGGGCRASRPGAGPAAAGRSAAERQAEGPGGAQRRGGGSLLFAQSHHVDDASTAEMGAESPARLPAPPAPRSRGGPSAPSPPLTCVPDDDILEEISVGHGRPLPAAPAPAGSFVTRALSPRPRCQGSRCGEVETVNGHRAAAHSRRAPPRPPLALSYLRPCHRRAALGRWLPYRRSPRRRGKADAATGRTGGENNNRRRAAPDPPATSRTHLLAPPRPRPGSAEAAAGGGARSPPAGVGAGLRRWPRPAGRRAEGRRWPVVLGAGVEGLGGRIPLSRPH